MLRLSRKHWWALILTLLLCSASIASRPVPARAGDDPSHIWDGTPGPQNGDPDLPQGPAKGGVGRGAVQQDGSGARVRTVGEGRITNRVWILRFQVMVRTIRSWYLRF